MLSPKDTVKSMTLQHVGVDSLSRSSLAVGNDGDGRHPGSEARTIRDLLTTCLSLKDTSEINDSTTRGQ